MITPIKKKLLGAQRCQNNFYPETERIITQQKLSYNDKLLVHVVINPRTNPWTIYLVRQDNIGIKCFLKSVLKRIALPHHIMLSGRSEIQTRLRKQANLTKNINSASKTLRIGLI
ncbi:hypothetical protein RIR_jg29421.t1 [Rhizophagus irregularis DAOM 181602=DAOM 197198]|nr:hypothetical protein RIR_jg29421.t1 [Rhizophagus irregularis DAOM 181602=DAOM 197198]CAB4491011.1 unnamed protein product [Rhizophagus irregularis]